METNNVRLCDLLNILNCQIKYRVTDKYTREPIKLLFKDKDILKRNVYMIFQDYDGTLNIVLS